MRYNMLMNIIYTHNLNGRLEHFPRLFTYIKRLVGGLSPKPLLLDLGGSCTTDQWHCRATDGRSALIALDAMGYHAVNIYGLLSANSYAKLKDQVLMTLVHDAQVHIINNVVISLSPTPSMGVWMPQVCLAASDSTHMQDDWLYLQKIAGDEVGVVQINGNAIHHSIHKIPANTIPDPTISGVVDFVLAEAKLYRDKK
ncbi:MAG: hypothetical protein CUN52_08010 [Phototrophicales bacterium]|jgi:hypothetical protein|nr:MAG: hypothetical protein CUN52_08010 [Phototrophicales bacterium]